MFLGWYDPDKTVATIDKLIEAMDRYAEKFGHEPHICLTGAVDAAALDGQSPIPVRPVTFVARHTFYVGIEEQDAPS